MTDQKIWSYSKNLIELERDEFGVYALLNSSAEIVFIGNGLIRKSLLRYSGDAKSVITPRYYKVEYVGNEELANHKALEELEIFHKRHGRYPVLNEKSKR